MITWGYKQLYDSSYELSLPITALSPSKASVPHKKRHFTRMSSSQDTHNADSVDFILPAEQPVLTWMNK